MAPDQRRARATEPRQARCTSCRTCLNTTRNCNKLLAVSWLTGESW